MGKAPAFQFYPSDWTRDLEEHPLEIEGAWIRICCKLWWEEERGTATKTLAKWARILHSGEKKSLSIVAYLFKHRIADVVIEKDAITITSRRMVRDEYIRRIRTSAGIRGGNPVLKKAPPEEVLDKQTAVKQNPTPSSSSSSSPSEKEISPPASASPPAGDGDFEQFWAHYPRKTAKQAAFAQWRKAKDRPGADEIAAAVERQKRHKAALRAAGRFCPEWPDPERYIRKRRWEDEIADPEPADGAWVPREYVPDEPAPVLSEEQRQENLRRIRELTACLK